MATYGQLNADNLTSSTGGVISPNITSLQSTINTIQTQIASLLPKANT